MSSSEKVQALSARSRMDITRQLGRQGRFLFAPIPKFCVNEEDEDQLLTVPALMTTFRLFSLLQVKTG